MNNQKYTYSLSFQTIALFILFPLALFFIWSIRDIIFSLLIGFILMSALRPGVKRLIDVGVPHYVAVILVYLLFIFIVTLLISLIIPPIIFETTGLIANLPLIVERISPQMSKFFDLEHLSSYVPNVTDNVVSLISGIFSNTVFVVSTLFFGLYLLLDEELLGTVVHRYAPKDRARRIVALLRTAEQRMSSWFWGEVTLMTLVGIFTFIGLNIIGVRYAIPLAVLAGLLEIVPNIGPTISAIPAVIIGFSMSAFTGVSTLALYIVIQQLENSFVVPMVMKRAVGINPIVTLLMLLIGTRVGGILGVLLAIPIFLFVETIAAELLHLSQYGNNAEIVRDKKTPV